MAPRLRLLTALTLLGALLLATFTVTFLLLARLPRLSVAIARMGRTAEALELARRDGEGFAPVLEALRLPRSDSERAPRLAGAGPRLDLRDRFLRGRVDDDVRAHAHILSKPRRSSQSVTVAWLIGIARHKLADHWRRAEREQRRLTDHGFEVERVENAEWGDDLVARRRGTGPLPHAGGRLAAVQGGRGSGARPSRGAERGLLIEGAGCRGRGRASLGVDGRVRYADPLPTDGHGCDTNGRDGRARGARAPRRSSA